MSCPWRLVQLIAVIVSYQHSFFNFCDPKFKLLLRLLTIVTISRLKMMYFEPFDVFYLDFHTLDLYYSATGTTSWAGRTVLIRSQFITTVTIGRFKLLYFEPFGLFYRDFLLLICIIRQPVRLVGLVVLFSSGANFRCGW